VIEQVGVFTAHDLDLARALEVWRTAEHSGLDAVGVVDSPLLMREAFVSLTALAYETSRIRMMSTVMNTLTRDPTVVAGAYLGLRDLAGGRVALAFGAGDSSTVGAGLGTASPARMGEFLEAVRDLMSGREATFGDRVLRGVWGVPGSAAPLLMSAHGPRALAAAGRHADGVICGFGVLPETIARAETLIRAGALEAGRDPEALEIWHVAHYCPAPTVAEGFLHANGASASVLARGGLAGKLVPDHLQDAVRRVGAAWSLERHGRPNEEALDAAVASGSLDYLVSRAGGLVGPVDLPAQLHVLAAAGVRNLMVVALGSDKVDLMRTLGGGVAAYREQAVSRSPSGL
jgi:alkanesulfonate monooxygenase SsuD/methylene tetrahydromethanopterin reductase-like flavin-dependent oxidoreductase (luciferase family)